MKDMAAYEEEARHLAKLGDMHKAQIILTKKKHAEKEVFHFNFSRTLFCENIEININCANCIHHKKTSTFVFALFYRSLL